MTATNQNHETKTVTVPSSSSNVDNTTISTKSDSSSTHTIESVYDNDDVEVSLCNRKPKTISFSTIEIREYPIVPGDNPASVSGVPVTIDWDHVETASCSVDDYEANKPESRSMVELRMPPSHRNDMLRGLGFSRSEILVSLRNANIIRNQRRRTSETMQLSKAHEALEKVKRATLNATLRRSRKSREKKLLQSFAAQSTATCGKEELVKDDSRHTCQTVDEDDDSQQSVEDEVELFIHKPSSTSLFRHKDSIRVR